MKQTFQSQDKIHNVWENPFLELGAEYKITNKSISDDEANDSSDESFDSPAKS